MRKIVVGLIFSTFFGLNLFGSNYVNEYIKACDNGDMESCTMLGWRDCKIDN